MGKGLQNSNTDIFVKIFKYKLKFLIFTTGNIFKNLPLMQAPVRGSHLTPGGQCSQPVVIVGVCTDKKNRFN